MDVYVFQKDGPTVTVRASRDTTIKSLKLEIQEKLGICPEQQALYRGEQNLNDQSTMYNLSIRNGYSIRLKVLPKNLVKVFVHSLEGDTVSFFAQPSDNRAVLLSKLRDKTGCDGENLTLYRHTNEILSEGFIVEDEGSVQTLTLRATGGFATKLRIVIRYRRNESLFLEAMSSDTVKTLKTAIDKELSLDPSWQQLYYREKRLTDSDTLTKSGVVTETALDLKIVAPVPTLCSSHLAANDTPCNVAVLK